MSKVKADKIGLVSSHDLSLDKDYVRWIHELKQRFRNAQIKAAVKVNSEQLLFNWQLGRDLVSKRAEEKWGKGVVEQVSLDLQAEFPDVKGFGTSNLWYMKKWYQFYEPVLKSEKLQQLVGEIVVTENTRLEQIGTAVEELQQPVGEIGFPMSFSYVPWGHHILIITKCKEVEEALFYLKLVVDKGLSRNALDDYIRSDYYNVSGKALTNFQENQYVQHALAGIRVCVCVLILEAIIRLWKKSIVDPIAFVLYIVIFSLMAFSGFLPFRVPAAALVIAAGIAGVLIRGHKEVSG